MQIKQPETATSSFQRYLGAYRGTELTPAVILALIIAFIPILGGLLFRKYGFVVSPDWFEGLRQIDFPDILVELLIIIWARDRGMDLRRLFRALDRPTCIALMLFLATFSIGAMIVAPVPQYSLLRALYWVIHIVFGFAVFHLLRDVTKRDVNRFSIILAVGLVAYIPIVGTHFALAPEASTTGGQPVLWTSSVPGYRSVRELGFLAGYVLALWIGYTGWNSGKPLRWVLHFLITTALFTVLFWSGTRAAILGVAIASVIAVGISRKFPPTFQVLMLIGAAAAAIPISNLLLPPDASFGLFRMSGFSGSADEISSGRVTLWTETWNLFLQQPFFGWGEGSIAWLSDFASQGFHKQPHNFILQCLMSFGVIAASAAFYLIGRILFVLHNAASRMPALIGLIMIIDTILITAMFDGALFFSRTIMASALAIAFCFALIVNEKKSTDIK